VATRSSIGPRRTLGRDVAIKVLNVDDEARAARFAREVEITVDLGRPHAPATSPAAWAE
jgi:hypothetical protein